MRRDRTEIRVAAGVPVRSCGTLVREPPLYHFNGPIGYDSDNCNIVHVLDTHENSVDGRVRSRSRETMESARAADRREKERGEEREKGVGGGGRESTFGERRGVFFFVRPTSFPVARRLVVPFAASGGRVEREIFALPEDTRFPEGRRERNAAKQR